MRVCTRWVATSLFGLALFDMTGCATSAGETRRRSFSRYEELRNGPAANADADELGGDSLALDGSLAGYVGFAMRHHPGLEAEFERWRAATEAIGMSRQGPPLTISYTGFVRAIETRVGPQRGRLGIRQTLPWPAMLRAGAEADAGRAETAERDFEARLLSVQAEVSRAYWSLWLVHRVHALRRAQDGLLEGLSAAVRTRMELGHASLGDVAAVELQLARHRDHHAAHREDMRLAAARLRAAIGAPRDLDTPVVLPAPSVLPPEEDEEALLSAALEAPRVARHEAMARAMSRAAEREDARRMPSFGVGFDWIQIGEAVAPMPDSGRDAVALSVSMSVPLWQSAGRASARAARAEVAAIHADERAAREATILAFEETLSRLRDTIRRVRLHRDAFIPQAETAYASHLGGYPSGRGTLADLIMAETALIELQTSEAELTARYAIVWASLEELVGRPVERGEANDGR